MPDRSVTKDLSRGRRLGRGPKLNQYHPIPTQGWSLKVNAAVVVAVASSNSLTSLPLHHERFCSFSSASSQEPTLQHLCIAPFTRNRDLFYFVSSSHVCRGRPSRTPFGPPNFFDPPTFSTLQQPSVIQTFALRAHWTTDPCHTRSDPNGLVLRRQLLDHGPIVAGLTFPPLPRQQVARLGQTPISSGTVLAIISDGGNKVRRVGDGR